MAVTTEIVEGIKHTFSRVRQTRQLQPLTNTGKDKTAVNRIADPACNNQKLIPALALPGLSERERQKTKPQTLLS